MAAGSARHDRRYRIIKVLGRGGMGQVYLAEKLNLDGTKARDVVLKTIIPTGSAEEIARRKEMFLREMKVAAKLEHRNIVRVSDWGRDLFGSEHYFEMERVEGISLLALLSAQGDPTDEGKGWGPLSPQDVAWVGMQAAAGLHYAHTFANTDESRRGGVAHRDISPDNLMGDINGEVKIADWGITRAVDQEGVATKTKTFAGKIRYMSPEQLQGVIDVRSDIYSLGVTLTTLLAGRHVFTAPPNANEHFYAVLIVKGERPTVAELAPDAPPALQRLLERMMEVDRDKRPRTAAEVVDECETIALELGGRLTAVQRAFAAKITPHFKRGNATIRETRGIDPDAHSVPVKSTRRPISAATVPDSPAQNKTQQLPVEPTAEMPGAASPSAPGAAPNAPTESKQRPLLFGALAGSSLLLLALVTGALAFMAAGPGEAPHTPSATAEATDDPDDTVATDGVSDDTAAAETVAGDTNTASAEPEATEPALDGDEPDRIVVADLPAPTPPQVQAVVTDPEPEPTVRVAEVPGRARIIAVPEGQISVDGRSRGASPVTLSLPPGMHTVVARRPDGRTARQRVRVRSGRTTEVILRYP